jgi:hypothetical protein
MQMSMYFTDPCNAVAAIHLVVFCNQKLDKLANPTGFAVGSKNLQQNSGLK